MPPTALSISAGADQVVLARDALRVEITLRPLAFTVRRAGRRLLRAGGLWAADGEIHDHFVQLTEGVIAGEERSPDERALRATVTHRRADGVQLAVELHGPRCQPARGAHRR